MSRQLTILILPNETVRFPGLCSNCARPAAESMELRQRDGRISRRIDVPICAHCADQLQKTSAAEERLQRQIRLFAPIVALLVMIAALLLFSGIVFWLRLLIALLLAVLAGIIVVQLFRKASAKAVLAQKKAVLESAHLQAFTWRTATFAFNNETFIEHFIELNEAVIQSANNTIPAQAGTAQAGTA